ncbi:hypothetical protein G6F40_017456 [Rhizopus arrhizus]|nr:hypothetical protein G6F40_017456 [Rhizopus arrhizus]
MDDSTPSSVQLVEFGTRACAHADRVVRDAGLTLARRLIDARAGLQQLVFACLPLISPRRQRAVGIDRCALVGTAVCHVEPDALAASRLDAKHQMRVDRCHDPRTLDDDAVVP